MSHTVDHHRAVADPFGQGHSGQQLGLAMNLTGGFIFPWLEGGVALLRRGLYPDVHEWEYCGLAIGEDAQLKNYPTFGHSVNQAYQYSAVTFLGNGMISAMQEPIRLDFDGNGDLISPRLPNCPVNVTASAMPGGKYRVVWEYEAYGQGDFPTDFQVFEGATPGGVDYNTPLTDSETGESTVSYVGNRRIYSFATAAYDNLSKHVFAVRGRSSNAVAEKNTYTTQSHRAHSAAPGAAAAAERVCVVSYSRRKG